MEIAEHVAPRDRLAPYGPKCPISYRHNSTTSNRSGCQRGDGEYVCCVIHGDANVKQLKLIKQENHKMFAIFFKCFAK